MEPAVGIEPTTYGLQNRCSTAELSWLETIDHKALHAVIFAAYSGACLLKICIWHVPPAMITALPSPTRRQADVEWVKTPCPNLIRYKPGGNYFGRVRVNGKLIRRYS
jgi:hypothetical protein